ncbi:hypothetical protein KB206_20615 [Microvirga sp. STS02]|uniref:hypothetical protein n=1 Tax=Hymenobacter negativus TaxID=2795026 RepID=UPI0018DB4F9D|nr:MULTISPECIES: hypothetical protein [Bacteria]MBH8571307.1 hypothetical protein [Hymenobacter negativus]MBR7211045.1 hypothetical protein [Microvirga sp. STS02]
MPQPDPITDDPTQDAYVFERGVTFGDGADKHSNDRIRELAKVLDAHRKRQQAQHPSLTPTDLYNVVEKLRAGQLLTAKEQTTHAHSLATVVLSLHQQLDAAVAEAYGWPDDLPEADILPRLMQLNHARQQEEAASTICYLCPAYQAPDEQQATLTLPSTAATPTAAAETSPQPWPAGLAQQMQAVRGIVQQAGQSPSSAQLHKRYMKNGVSTPLSKVAGYNCLESLHGHYMKGRLL